MKRCCTCRETKPVVEFSRYVLASDGLQPRCKACCRTYQQSERGRKVNRVGVTRYRRSEKGKAAAKRYLQSEKGREKRLVWRRVWYAKATGKLISQPCRDCGATPTVTHHEDYSKPLNVIWLCRSCHRRLHRNLQDEIEVKAKGEK